MLVYPADAADAVRRFAEAWNTADAAERRLVLQSCCSADAEFAQPQGTIRGLDAFNASIGAFLRACPRGEVRFGAPDTHSGFVRVRWRTLFNDGAREPIFGEDFIELDAQSRILRVVSFDGSTGDA